jgi:hypothetical protein
LAETKQIGKLENLITFKIDKTSFDSARKKIQQIKNEMKGISKPLQEALKPARAAQKMKSDYLVVQKQLDKVEKQQLKTAEALAKARNKQALAEQKIQNQRRAQSVRGLTARTGAGKASQSLFADMLRQEERDLKEMNRLHGQALAENMKRDQKIQNLYDRRRQAVLSARSSATAKRIARREREQSRASREQGSINNRNMRMDRRAQATQEWFGSTFGRGGQRKAAALYGDLRSGKINAEQYSTRLRSLRAELYRNQRAQRGFNQSIHDMRGAFIQATASYTAFAGVMGIANIGKQYEAQKAQMLVATGSKEQAASQLDYLRSETYRLGLDREQASQGYSQIAMAGQKDIGVGGVNKVFSGLSELATATKLEPFKYEKVVNAMAQMLSKQQIYSEELEL